MSHLNSKCEMFWLILLKYHIEYLHSSNNLFIFALSNQIITNMKINIETLDREVFKIALEEEVERQTFTQNKVKRQIKNNIRFDGDSELVDELDRMRESFRKISRNHNDVLEISEEERMFLERLVKNQTIISNSRIADWQPDTSIVTNLKRSYFEQNKNASEEEFEKARLDIIQYDINLKNCMKELANILGVEYDDKLTMHF